jgi:hypothetical protein
LIRKDLFSTIISFRRGNTFSPPAAIENTTAEERRSLFDNNIPPRVAAERSCAGKEVNKTYTPGNANKKG